MKKPYIKSVAVLAISLGLPSCGDGGSDSYKVSKAEELALMEVEDELMRLKKDPGYIYAFNANMEQAAVISKTLRIIGRMSVIFFSRFCRVC